MTEITLSQLDGFYVGQAEDRVGGTGCTAILTPEGAVASYHLPGFAPGSRETDLLRPDSLAPVIHGLLLTDGSAFGLAAADGVVKFLRERGVGFDTGLIRVPLVPAAVIFDYPGNKSGGTLPDEAMGYRAAAAADKRPVPNGPFGAGLSAACGKLAGPDRSSPSGLGSYGLKMDDGLMVAALVAANPLGGIVDPDTGAVLSGPRLEGGRLANKKEILEMLRAQTVKSAADPGHTVLVAVGTNARLDKLGAHRLARMASAGIARAVYPAHLMFDGDTVFALSSNTGPEVDLSWLGALAADAVSQALVRSAPRFWTCHD